MALPCTQHSTQLDQQREEWFLYCPRSRQFTHSPVTLEDSTWCVMQIGWSAPSAPGPQRGTQLRLTKPTRCSIRVWTQTYQRKDWSTYQAHSVHRVLALPPLPKTPWLSAFQPRHLPGFWSVCWSPGLPADSLAPVTVSLSCFLLLSPKILTSVHLTNKTASYFSSKRWVYLGRAENCNPGQTHRGETIGKSLAYSRWVLFDRESGEPIGGNWELEA